MYRQHVFICTNGKGETADPNAKKPRCGWKNSEQLRADLKAECAQRFGKNVRINSAGCLGQCERGIAAVIYPQAEWFYELTNSDAQKFLGKIKT